MSGHNKWSKIKRDKGTKDSKRAAVFTKLGHVITVAAREKGGDPDTNFSLRLAIDKAKQANMPKENIERAIKKGTGELAGETVEELYYEGIGPAGVQFVVKSLTDNRNRSASNIRHIFTKYGGSLGSVIWNFEKKNIVNIEREEVGKHDLVSEEKELDLIEAGAEEIEREEEGLTIYTNVQDAKKILDHLEGKGVKIESADIGFVPKETQEVSDEEREKIEGFIDDLEAEEDVCDYYHNII